MAFQALRAGVKIHSKITCKAYDCMKYRPEIDGLRSLAVIPVILYHAGFTVFGGGYVGVDVFFVISGYLITSIILNELEAGTFSLIHFYERRARRILPALFTVLFFCVAMAWFCLLPEAMRRFSESLVAVSVFASNIFFYKTTSYFDPAADLKPLLHTWSLAVEEQYYVVFPLFLMLAWRFGKRWAMGLLVVIFLGSLALTQWGVLRHPGFTFYMLPTRSWELLIGAFIAFYYANHNIKKHHHIFAQLGSLTGIFLIAYSVFYFNDQTPFPSVYTLVPTIGTALIIIFTTHKTVAGIILGSKPFVGIGLISYSAYLWHQPMFVFARERSLNEPSVYMMAILAALSFVFAYFSWKYIERPFRNKHRISRTKVLTYGALCSAFFIVFGVAGYLSGGFHSRLSDKAITLLYGGIEYPDKKHCLSHAGDYNHVADACDLGDKNNIIGALIGDSHSRAIAYALDIELKNFNTGIKLLTTQGCPPYFDVYTKYLGFICSQINKENYDYISKETKIKYVIISNRWSRWINSTSDFNNDEGGIEHAENPLEIIQDGNIQYIPESEKRAIVKQKTIEAINRYLQLDKKVILIYPIPEMGWNIPNRLAKQSFFNDSQLSAESASISYDNYLSRNKEVIRLLDGLGNDKNLIRVYPDKLFCNTYIKQRCTAMINGMPIYFDDDHLNTVGARILSDQILKQLNLSTKSH